MQTAWTDSTQTGIQSQHRCTETNTEFTVLNLPPGSVASIHCFVPIGEGGGHLSGGHLGRGQATSTPGAAHTAASFPNAIDPLGGWTDTGETYGEENCIERQRFVKHISSPTYNLHHTVSLDWGWVYMVEINPGPPSPPLPSILTITDEHSGEDW